MFIGKYEIVSELGDGGMGTVKLARAPSGALVVVKEPHPGDQLLKDLLIDEARVGLRLKHPNIVETLDFFELDGKPVLVVAFVSGGSLADIRATGPLEPGVVCRIGRQIAEALDALHHAVDEQGRPLQVLHRDVTPNNIMVGYDGNARLIDLGIAKHDDRLSQKTQTGFLRGTLRYMAPEVFDAGRYSPQSDLWALGVSLLDAALGRQAIRGSEGEIVARVISGRIIELRPGEKLDPDLEKALRKLLDPDPKKRPSRGKEAAALFIWLEKKLGVDEKTTRDALRRAVGEEPELDTAGGEATMRLVTHAQAAYGQVADRDDSEPAPEPAFTEPPSTMQIEEPSFGGADRTVANAGLREAARSASLGHATTPSPDVAPSVKDQIASYAEALRRMEGSSGEIAVVGKVIDVAGAEDRLGAPPSSIDDDDENQPTRLDVRRPPRDRRGALLLAAGLGVGLILGLAVIIGSRGGAPKAVAPVDPELAHVDVEGDAPACFVAGRTRFFSYRTPEGRVVMTSLLSEVPPARRADVVCGE